MGTFLADGFEDARRTGLFFAICQAFNYTIQRLDEVRTKKKRILTSQFMKQKGAQDYLFEMGLYGAIASLLLGGTVLGLVASLRRSRRDAQELADRKRNRLIKERLNETPPAAAPVSRRESPVHFSKRAGH